MRGKESRYIDRRSLEMIFKLSPHFLWFLDLLVYYLSEGFKAHWEELIVAEITI